MNAALIVVAGLVGVVLAVLVVIRWHLARQIKQGQADLYAGRVRIAALDDALRAELDRGEALDAELAKLNRETADTLIPRFVPRSDEQKDETV